MLPWLVGAAVVAGVGYLASRDDEPEECMYCSREVYRDGMCRRHYREEQEKEEREAARRSQERDEKRRIESEIESFKITSKKQIENKYGTNISFSGKSVNILGSENGKSGYLKEHISQLKSENSEIQNLVNDLQREKDAV